MKKPNWTLTLLLFGCTAFGRDLKLSEKPKADTEYTESNWFLRLKHPIVIIFY